MSAKALHGLAAALACCASFAGAQEPQPAAAPTPLATPAEPGGLSTAIGPPGIPTFADVAKGISKTVSTVNAVTFLAGGKANPLVNVATMSLTTLGAYYGVVGDRQKQADLRYQEAVQLIERDLKAAGVPGSFQKCTEDPGSCPGLEKVLTQETRAKVDQSARALDSFVSGFDLNTWSEQEKGSFLQQVGPKAALGLTDGLLKGNEYWEVVRKVRAGETVAEAFGPGSVPHPPETEKTVDPADLTAAAQALAAQGAATNALNREAVPPRTGSQYAADFGRESDKEIGQLDRSAQDAQSKFDAFVRDLKAEDKQLLSGLKDSGPKIDSVASPGPPTSSPAAPTAKPAAIVKPADHCPNGVFVCPNGNPWPKCTHPEKYQCPPPEFAAEASRGQAKPPTKN